MRKYFIQANPPALKNFFWQSFNLLSFVVLFFSLSCNNAGNEKTSEDSLSKTTVDSSGNAQQPLHGEFPTYKITKHVLDSIDNKHKLKLILKLSFVNFPDTRTMKLQVYPAEKHKDDGTSENALTLEPLASTTTLTSNAFSFGNSHVDLKKMLKKRDHTDRVYNFLIFTPAIVDGHLVFRMTAFEDTGLTGIELGFSNPSPPAPPGGVDN